MTTKLTPKDLLVRYESGELDFMEANLHRANLHRANLDRANLRGANLGGANLRGANLGGANLSGVDLEGADLDGANLRRANLRGVDLDGANLRGVDLEGADLSGANLSGHTLGGRWQRFAPTPSGFDVICLAVHGPDHWVIRAGCRTFTLAEALEHWADTPEADACHTSAVGAWYRPRLALLDTPEIEAAQS